MRQQHFFFDQDWRRSVGYWQFLFICELVLNWLTELLISAVLYPIQMFVVFFCMPYLSFESVKMVSISKNR